MGTVEDINDPLKLGRVRVRIINHHDDEQPVEQLDWQVVMQPSTSAARIGIGSSPTGLVVGSIVIGAFVDGEARNVGVVFGSIAVIPQNDEQQHGVNVLARGEDRPEVEPLFDEPVFNTPSTYPNNHVFQTPQGHRIELDDTEGASIIRVRHANGAYVELTPDGDAVIRSNKIFVAAQEDASIRSGEEIVIQSKQVKITTQGDTSISATGTVDVLAAGPVNIKGSMVNIG